MKRISGYKAYKNKVIRPSPRITPTIGSLFWRWLGGVHRLFPHQRRWWLRLLAKVGMMRDLGFAFNDKDFSDRILYLEVVDQDSLDSESDSKGSHLEVPWTKKLSRKQKRRLKERGNVVDNNNSKCSNPVEVKTLHISSVILAGSSPFFYKLFKNGMRESHERDVFLRITTSEEAPLMDLLSFMYRNTLSATSAPELVGVLLAADKFEVSSCMRYCIEMLLKLPMSTEYALLYLELPSCVSASEVAKPLIDATKLYFGSHYNDFNTKSQEEAMELPLSAIEVVLGSKTLHVNSEDDVFDFILKWARVSYLELKERREILTNLLERFICFPNMSSSKLKEVLVCPEFDHEQVSKLVMEALFSKVELSCGQHIHPSLDLATTTDYDFLERRVYLPRCAVYFNLKKDELKSLLIPGSQLTSPRFCLGGKQLYLSAFRGEKKDRFSLRLQRAPDSQTCTINFELAIMKKSSKEFQTKLKIKNHALGVNGWRWKNILRLTPSSDDDDDFINDIIRLRVELTLVNNS